MPIRVAINGFGRIGRQVARQLLCQDWPELQLVAINTLQDIQASAFLLKHDSTSGPFDAQVCNGKQALLVNGQPLPYYSIANPSELPWHEAEVDIVVESTGCFTRDKQATGHLAAGAQKVLITAAADQVDATLVQGINHQDYDPDHHNLISASSCTTNCLAPALKILDQNFGIKQAMATFLHSYTSSQPLSDACGKDLRRSRSAITNIIPTTTSAETQIPMLLPSLQGRFKASAIRVPSPLTHLADLTAKLNRQVSRQDLLDVFNQAADHEMKGIIRLSNHPLVSIDFRGAQHSCILDTENISVYGDFLKMLIWHDNETSYCCRILDLLSHIGIYL